MLKIVRRQYEIVGTRWDGGKVGSLGDNDLPWRSQRAEPVGLIMGSPDSFIGKVAIV